MDAFLSKKISLFGSPQDPPCLFFLCRGPKICQVTYFLAAWSTHLLTCRVVSGLVVSTRRKWRPWLGNWQEQWMNTILWLHIYVQILVQQKHEVFVCWIFALKSKTMTDARGRCILFHPTAYFLLDKQLRQAPCCWKKWISQDQTKKLFQLYLANSHKSTSQKHHRHHHRPFHAAKLPAVISEGSPFGQRCTSSVVQALKKKSLPGWCSWSIFGQLDHFLLVMVVFHLWPKKNQLIKLPIQSLRDVEALTKRQQVPVNLKPDVSVKRFGV